MNIIIENESDLDFKKIYEEIILKISEEVLKFENLKTKNVEVNILIVDNNEMQIINRENRNINIPTDVLSFPAIEPENILKAFKENYIFLGDIVISFEKIISQSKEYNHSLEREIAFLTAHSMFHLLGYDHENKNEEKIMFSKQEEVLNKVGFLR